MLELACNPRDAYYLPFTMRMLAAWRVPELKEQLLYYLNGTEITLERLGVQEEEQFNSLLTHIRRELKFTALDGLKYFPSEDVYQIVKCYTFDADFDIRIAAEKTLKRIAKGIEEL